MSRFRPAKAPERSMIRAEIERRLGPHPRHAHPRHKRLAGGALKRAINAREQALERESLAEEKRRMANGRLRRVSTEGRAWLWSEVLRALGWGAPGQ